MTPSPSSYESRGCRIQCDFSGTRQTLAGQEAAAAEATVPSAQAAAEAQGSEGGEMPIPTPGQFNDQPSALWTLRRGDEEVSWEARLLPAGIEGRIVLERAGVVSLHVPER